MLRHETKLDNTSRAWMPETLALPERYLVATYCRNSGERQAQEMTVKQQLELVRSVVAREFVERGRSFTLVGEFIDEGYPLEIRDDERAFWRMLAAVRRGEVNCIIVANKDRVFRAASESLRGEITDTLRQYGVVFYEMFRPHTYGFTDTGSMLIESIQQTQGAASKLELKKRTHEGRRRRLVEERDFRFMTVPYGYRMEVNPRRSGQKKYQYRVVEDEAAVIRDIYRMYVGLEPEHLLLRSPFRKHVVRRSGMSFEGYGTTAIASVLNENGISRRSWADASGMWKGREYNDTWTSAAVTFMLKNTAYTGERDIKFNATDKIPGYATKTTVAAVDLPPILDRDLSEQVKAKLTAIGDDIIRTRAARKSPPWLLGLLVCPTCGKQLEAHLKRNCSKRRAAPEDEVFYYLCKGHCWLVSEFVEKRVEDALLAEFLDTAKYEELGARQRKILGLAENRAAVIKTDIEHINKQIGEVNAELVGLTRQFARGTITEGAYTAASDAANSELSDLQSKLQQKQLFLRTIQTQESQAPAIGKIRDAMQIAINTPAARRQLLDKIAPKVIERIEILEQPVSPIPADIDEVRRLYHSGLVTYGQLIAAGWTRARILKLGGRKYRIQNPPVRIVYRNLFAGPDAEVTKPAKILETNKTKGRVASVSSRSRERNH